MDLPEKRIYRFADVEVDASQNCLKRGSAEQHLRQKAFFVLVYLLEQRPRLVTKEELMEAVWKNTAVTDDALVQCVKEIRRAIGDDSHNQSFIKTVPKSGYRFIGIVEESENGFQADLIDSAATKTVSEPTFSLLGLLNRRKVLFALLLLIAVVFLIGFLGQTARKSGQIAAKTVSAAAAGKKTIAVMFFDNQTGGTELEWLREGLVDMLTTDLSRSPKLSVVSRQQLYLLLDRSDLFQESAEISFAQALEVVQKIPAKNFITGSFAKAGDKIRIDAQLHDAETGALLAAESLIAENSEEILTGIDLLSLKLAKHLGANEPENQMPLADAMTDNLEAYRYYSLGTEKAQALHNKEAIELLEKAVALDPQFAMAHARIGYAYAVSWGIIEKGKPHLEKAYKMADRLSEKDRLQINAWYAIANLDFPSAIQTYREIISKYPLETENYWCLGKLLSGEERADEAVEVLRQGLIIDAEAKDIYNTLGGIYSESGKHAEAIAARQRYVELAPDEANAYDSLGLAYQWAGEYQKAFDNYNRALELKPSFEIAVIHLANVNYQTGQYRQAISLFQRYIAIAPSAKERARGWDNVAQVYFKMGDLSAAEKAANEVYKSRKDFAWSAYLIASEKEDAARMEKIEKTIVEEGANTDRGARSKLRFELYYRGYIAQKKGQIDQAVANFQEAVRRKPPIWNLDSYEDCLANAYLEQSRFDEAIAEYQRILQLNPNYPLARFHLAQAFERKGQLAEAHENYRSFLEIWKNADADIREISEARNSLDKIGAL